MTEALLALPAHLRRRLAQALESGTLAPPWSAVALRSALGLRDDGADVAAALAELERLGVAGPAAAAWIRRRSSSVSSGTRSCAMESTSSVRR